MHLMIPNYIRERAIKAGVRNFSLFFTTVLTAFLSHEPITMRLADGSVFHFYHGPGAGDELLDAAESQEEDRKLLTSMTQI
jgi:hypothetical protein